MFGTSPWNNRSHYFYTKYQNISRNYPSLSQNYKTSNFRSENSCKIGLFDVRREPENFKIFSCFCLRFDFFQINCETSSRCLYIYILLIAICLRLFVQIFSLLALITAAEESKWTTILCKVNFSRQIFLLYFGKGNFGGKNIYFAKEVFPIKIS